jgi:hypothetical protein
MAENKYKFITKKWMFNLNEFCMDCHPKHAAKCAQGHITNMMKVT